MKKTQRKLIALSLTLCLLLSLALPATAKTADNTLSEYEQERQASTAERAELDVTTVPEIIGAETANDRGHTRRVYEDEGNDLNKLVFGNDDGSKTMYLFNYPVKFLDKNGMIQDISLDISNSSDESTPFRSKSAGVVTSFSKNIDGGIYLDGNGVSLRLVPHVEEARDRQVRRLSTKTVVYPYNEYTTIEYSLTYTGLKEDIVVSQYTGQTEYSFTLHTNGLELTELDGNYYLVDGDQTIQATIGDIIVITADERNNTMGQLRTETVVENEEYLLTIVLDPEYLSDPNTAYPIRIDPTLEVNYDQDGAGAIVDLTIGSNATYSGTSGSVLVGLRETKGVTRTLMRFPGLDLSGLEGAEVLSATVELRDLLCEGTNLTVCCYPYTGTAWTETSTWSGLTQSWGELLSSNVITYNNGYALSPRHRYSFDITAAVQGWIDGDYAQSKGIIFKASSAVETGTTYDFRTFASYNRASNKPSLTVTYNSAVGDITTATGKDCVNEGSTLQLSTSMEGTVTWTSSRTGIATVSSTGVVTGIQAGSTTITASCEGYTDKTFTLWVTVPDGVYYFKNASSGLCMQTTEDITNVYTQDERDDSRVNQLWKVAYISNGNYVIRPLRNFSVAMTVSNTGYVAVETAPADNSSVSAGMYWKIIHNAFGYALKHSGADSQTAMPTVNGLEGAPVYPSSWTSSMTCHWELEAIQGVFLRDTTTLKTTDSSTIKYIELGESVGYAELGLRYECYGNVDFEIEWVANDCSIANVSSSTGVATGIKRGKTIVAISATLNGRSYTAQFSLVVNEVISVINLYDSSLTSTAVSYIDDAVAFLNTIYSEDFYLCFKADGEPVLYDLFLEAGAHPSSGTCTSNECGSLCTDHHNNVHRIANTLYDEFWEKDHVVVLWSNYPSGTYCYLNDYRQHIPLSSLALVTQTQQDEGYIYQPVVQVINIESVNSYTGTCTVKSLMLRLLAHEIAHTLGVDEIYNGAYGNTGTHDTAQSSCIMGLLYHDTVDEIVASGSLALCDSCRTIFANEINGKDVYER